MWQTELVKQVLLSHFVFGFFSLSVSKRTVRVTPTVNVVATSKPFRQVSCPRCQVAVNVSVAMGDDQRDNRCIGVRMRPHLPFC